MCGGGGGTCSDPKKDSSPIDIMPEGFVYILSFSTPNRNMAI